jgi:hypothetical protein
LIRWVALRVLLVLGGLAALYLVGANVLIRTSLLRQLANSSPSVKLEYASAYSLLPGRVHVRDLVLRSEDYNVQFEVKLASGVVDVNLLELASKRFHALRVRAEGVTFRARHKVHAVGLNARRLAAYPPIAGFTDPPLYRGKAPAPISEEDYDLWEIALDDVEGSVREIWILEHRFEGKARVRGAFQMRPARHFELAPSKLEIESGTLSVGRVPTAREVQGALTCTVQKTFVERVTGLEILRTFTAELELRTKRGDLAAADVYIEPRLGVTATGDAALDAKLSLKNGVIAAGSRFEVKSSNLSLLRGRERLSGAATARLVTKEARVLELCGVASRVRLERRDASGKAEPGPTLDDASVCAAFAPPDLTRDVTLHELSGSVRDLENEKLGWWSEPLERAGSRLRLSGGLAGGFRFSARPSGALTLNAKVDLRSAFLTDRELGVLTSGKATLALEPSKKSEQNAVGTLLLVVPHAKFVRGKAISDEVQVRLHSNDLSFENVPGKRRLSGSAELRAGNVESLLKHALGSPVLVGLSTAVLGVDELEAVARFEFTAQSSRVEVRRAQSGALKARGFITADRNGPTTGSFLFDTPIANFGLSLRGSDAKVEPLVSNSWLPKGWATLGGGE